MKPTHRVYVVDDEPLIASKLAAILSDSGYEVEFFTNPLVTLAAVASGFQPFLSATSQCPISPYPCGGHHSLRCGEGFVLGSCGTSVDAFGDPTTRPS